MRLLAGRIGANHPYLRAGALIMLVLVLTRWDSYVTPHEQIYLIGPHKVADPSLLAADFSWSDLPPTTFLFDHLVAPLWRFLDEFAIANIGRFTIWLLLAWSIAMLASTLQIPPWSAVVGFTIWILWGQTLAYCGSPEEGFQVKSFSYPLMFFSIAFAMRGQMVRAGLAAGLGTAFHIVVGGLGCMALFLSMLVNRQSFSLRRLATFLMSAAPFIVPLVIAVATYYSGSTTAAERAQMDEIYVMFAAPHCCDVSRYMDPTRWVRAVLIFAATPLLVFCWPQQRESRILGWFLVATIALFWLGAIGQWLHWYALLKFFPGQLAKALPALFMFIFFLAFFSSAETRRRFGRGTWIALALAIGLLVDGRDVFPNVLVKAGSLVEQLSRPVWGGPIVHEPFYTWVRKETPRDAVFITPFIHEFWPYAQRAQVASMRHPPSDRRLIEWKQRLEAINGFQEFEDRGWYIEDELEAHVNHLTIEQLARIRDLYGATHYVSTAFRADLDKYVLYEDEEFHVYDIRAATSGLGTRHEAPAGE